MRRRSFLGFELNPGWRWMVFQGVVATCVIVWVTQEMPADIKNPWIPGLAGIVAAFLATVFASSILARWRAFRARRSSASDDARRRELGFTGAARGPRDALQQPPRVRIGNDPR
jgi:uncharacterized membrane protein YccC